MARRRDSRPNTLESQVFMQLGVVPAISFRCIIRVHPQKGAIRSFSKFRRKQIRSRWFLSEKILPVPLKDEGEIPEIVVRWFDEGFLQGNESFCLEKQPFWEV